MIKKNLEFIYILIILIIVILIISYAAAQSSQGHPWTEIILPTSPNVWTGLNADMLDGLHYADFSARLWSGYDPNTDNIWYNDGGNVGIGTENPNAKLEVRGGPIKATDGLIIESCTDGINCPNDGGRTPEIGQMWLIK